MKTTKLVITVFVMALISQLAKAQILDQSMPRLPQINKIDSVVNKLPHSLNDDSLELPLNNSLLPSIDSLIWTPLSSLPDTLAIGGNIQNPAWTEVRVEDNWRAVKNQWIVLADASTKSTLISLGASIETERTYAGLNLSLLRFTVPDNVDSKTLLAGYLSQTALMTLDRNHVYQAQSAKSLNRANTDAQKQAESKNTQLRNSFCINSLRIGMIDSAIEQAHPAFHDAKITAKSFLTGKVKSPTLHGTAVASVLLGAIDNQAPLLKNAHLFSAEVFYRQSDYAQGATLNAIIEAINWLIIEKVKVINMSLAGPDNAILNTVINAAHQQGAFIVAAAGNEGPAAPAVYPAGYDDVIAVSAIDQHQQPYRWSNQGPYIDFAALGVNVLTAQSQQSIGRESGTSMAAPVVSAALACTLANLSDEAITSRNKVLNKLAEIAIDLGPIGKDPIFGLGAIQPQ